MLDDGDWIRTCLCYLGGQGLQRWGSEGSALTSFARKHSGNTNSREYEWYNDGNNNDGSFCVDNGVVVGHVADTKEVVVVGG